MSVTLTTLPIEIQRQYLNYLDNTTLKSTRLVCSVLEDIAAEALLSVASLQSTEQSADSFQGLIRQGRFRRYIRQVSILP